MTNIKSHLSEQNTTTSDYNVFNMAAERFFTKIAQDVLDATERLANHLDDHFSQIFGRSNDDRTDGNDTGRDSSTDKDFNIIDDNDEEDATAGSPLQGMADQVLNGIMDGQVGRSVVDLVGILLLLSLLFAYHNFSFIAFVYNTNGT